jgi:hypothetical protein
MMLRRGKNDRQKLLGFLINLLRHTAQLRYAMEHFDKKRDHYLNLKKG